MSATISLSSRPVGPPCCAMLGGDLRRLLARHRCGARFTRVAVRHAEHRHRVDALLDAAEVDRRRVSSYGYAGMIDCGVIDARVLQVAHVPEVGILAALAREVRTDAARAPLERMVVDELARLRVLAVALGLVTERPDHLRVAVEATLADVDVAARRARAACTASPTRSSARSSESGTSGGSRTATRRRPRAPSAR